MYLSVFNKGSVAFVLISNNNGGVVLFLINTNNECMSFAFSSINKGGVTFTL